MRLRTGIAGIDQLTNGGLPLGRSALLTGGVGSGKTVLAAQFLAEGILQDDVPGVFVTFEEPVDDLRTDLTSLGWDVAGWEEDDLWVFVDATTPLGTEFEIAGPVEFHDLLGSIEAATGSVGAPRVAIDSVSVLLDPFDSPAAARLELYRLVQALRELDVTVVMTADDDGGVAPKVLPTVIALDRVTTLDETVHTIEVVKLRGGAPIEGRHPFEIRPLHGVVIAGLSEAVPPPPKLTGARAAAASSAPITGIRLREAEPDA